MGRIFMRISGMLLTMRAVIVGYGRVGIRTARILKEEGHEVAIIDNDPEKIRRARGEGFEAVEASGDDPAALEAAGVVASDAVAALTGDVEINHAVCAHVAKHDVRTVLRVDADYPDKQYRRYADIADAIIYPEQLGAAGAKTALLGGDVAVLAELAEHLQLSVLTVSDDAPVVGDTIGRLDLPTGARLYAHGRGDESLTVPLPSTQLRPDDRVALLIERDAVDQTRARFLGA